MACWLSSCLDGAHLSRSRQCRVSYSMVGNRGPKRMWMSMPKRLFAKAYWNLLRGGPEAEAMRQSVLANQFVSGLVPKLKAKVVGTEGTMDQQLIKAKFEEANRRELATLPSSAPSSHPKKTGSCLPSTQSQQGSPKAPLSSAKTVRPERNQKGCYNCDIFYARSYKKLPLSQATKGRPRGPWSERGISCIRHLGRWQQGKRIRGCQGAAMLASTG